MNNTISDDQPLVSIIMPVYNAEHTLSASIASVLAQTYPAIELILINDASTDESLHIMQQEQKQNSTCKEIRIISQAQNGGVAEARNIGLAEAKGRYIYWVDSDDSLEQEAIEKLVKQAQQTSADIVGCGWFLVFSTNKRRMPQSAFTSPKEALEKLMSGVMRWNLWLFMIDRAFLQQHPEIRFEPHKNMGEDMMFMLKLFAVAQRVSFVDQPLYFYSQQNQNSLTRIYNEKHHEEVTHNVQNIAHFLRCRYPQDAHIEHLIALLKLTIKLPLLFTGEKADYRMWREWFPEANPFVLKNKMLPLRTKLIQWSASRGLFLPIKIYYMLVFKCVYGILYK